MSLIISQSPHIRAKWDVQKIMRLVFIALLPAAIAGTLVFGYRALMVIIAAVASSWVFDVLLQALIRKHQKQYTSFKIINWSSLVTGLLLGLILPPLTPLYLPVIGSLVAIGLGKYAFGRGNNIFNPALVGRAFLVFAFPGLMAGWIIPDAITQATPLGVLKDSGIDSLSGQFGSAGSMYGALAIGNVGGSIGETSAIAILIGGLFLLALGIIRFHIPAVFIGTVGCISLLAGRDVLVDILGGGLLLGAFFMATDYVTSPLTIPGRIVFAFGCGALTMLFRIASIYPEGVAFSILLMNAAVPLIDRYIRPIPFGRSQGRCKA